MFNPRKLLVAALVAVTISPFASAQAVDSAAVRLNALGPENQALVRRAGDWDVIETIWSSPDAKPMTIKGLLAERRMVGSLLQETIRQGPGASAGKIMRIDYLTFNRVEGRWNYVSMDTRAPVGIMSAWSFERGDHDKISLSFEPFAMAGDGPDVTGQMLRMVQSIDQQLPDSEVKEQRFILADGTGKQWLAHRYEYSRKK